MELSRSGLRGRRWRGLDFGDFGGEETGAGEGEKEGGREGGLKAVVVVLFCLVEVLGELPLWLWWDN